MAYSKQSGHHVDVIMQVVTQSLSAMQWDAPFSLLASSLVFFWRQQIFSLNIHQAVPCRRPVSQESDSRYAGVQM